MTHQILFGQYWQELLHYIPLKLEQLLYIEIHNCINVLYRILATFMLVLIGLYAFIFAVDTFISNYFDLALLQ